MGADKTSNADGLPAMSSSEKEAGWALSCKMLAGFPIIGTAIGCGAAALILANADASKIHAANPWPFASGFVFTRLVSWLNSYPLLYKSQVMRTTSGNLRANMIVYEQIGESASCGKVVMAEGGDCGRYNRANRSLHHFVETSAPVVASIALVSQIVPFTGFVLTSVYALGRVLHQIGYASGYGVHAPGFILSTVSTEILGGLMLLTALKGLHVIS
jgi:hypothetical protein